VALGSGEAINEAITGATWPEKAERNARLLECVSIFRALFAGETVTHRGRLTVIEAKLYSRPPTPVPLFGAAVSAATARLAGSWADGLLIAGHEPAAIGELVDAFRAGGGDGKPVHVQMAVSYAATLATAEAQAVEQWAPAALGGEAAWDLRRPTEFDQASRFIGADNLREAVLITASGTEIADRLGALGGLGLAAVHLHQVGTNQEEFIDMAGTRLTRLG
jgi:G6PDH family F420-dependent oxidoreductase